MSPIDSPYDSRLAILLTVIVLAHQELALRCNRNSSEILLQNLYLATKQVHESGEEKYLEQAMFAHPILAEAIK